MSYAATTLSKLSGLSLGQCGKLANAIGRRNRALNWLPALVALAGFWGWMIAFGRGTDALEGTKWDVLAFLKDLGLGLIPSLVVGYGIAITLAVIAGSAVHRAILRRVIRHHLYSPACFWCGYSLVGLEVCNAAIQCPECGKVSPVASSTP